MLEFFFQEKKKKSLAVHCLSLETLSLILDGLLQLFQITRFLPVPYQTERLAALKMGRGGGG